jgi:hypothetical protein
VWGKNWTDWGYRTAQMEVSSNWLSAADPIWPDNVVWNPATDAAQLAAFITPPADSPVGLGFAVRTNRLTPALLTNGVPVRLSRFSTNVVSVHYAAETPATVLAAGTLVFQPGETVQLLPLSIPNPEMHELLSVSLTAPAHAEVTGLGQLFSVGTNAAPAPTTLIPFGATWRYFDNGVSQGTTWIPGAFDDSGWASNPAKFGYNSGNTGFATILDYGGDAANKYRTYYFRKHFTVAAVAAFDSLLLEVLRDDGIAVYLNGQDFYRDNLPAGPLVYSDFATNCTDNGGIIQSATLPLTNLVAGTNVLAAEVHQSSAGSSDLVFDLQLTANPQPPAGILKSALLGGALVLYWSDASFGLESAPQLSGPWTPMPPENAQAVSLTGDQRFFRLRK